LALNMHNEPRARTSDLLRGLRNSADRGRRTRALLPELRPIGLSGLLEGSGEPLPSVRSSCVRTQSGHARR